MKLATQTPKKVLKAFLKQKPLRSEIDLFKTNLIALLDKMKTVERQPKDETEEHLKNDLRDFLRDTYYRDTHSLSPKSSPKSSAGRTRRPWGGRWIGWCTACMV